MGQPQVVIRGIFERDIDLLLLEEFAVAEDFRNWFLQNIGQAGPHELTRAERSVSSASGETDLELTITAGSTTCRILIENKIDAMFQPRQAERYRQRAEACLERGEANSVLTVLIAPTIYLGDQQSLTLGFDRVVRYEEILDFFQRSAEPRRQYKATALLCAIEHAKKGYVLIPDPRVTDFWQTYWEHVREHAPDLRMLQPGDRPARSTFIYFRPDGLPPIIKLCHKFTAGHVDLQFHGAAEQLEGLRLTYGPHLMPPQFIDAAGNSGVIRHPVPVITVGQPFNPAALTAAISAARALLQIYRKANAHLVCDT